jgi:hypothetical protein
MSRQSRKDYFLSLQDAEKGMISQRRLVKVETSAKTKSASNRIKTGGTEV